MDLEESGDLPSTEARGRRVLLANLGEDWSAQGLSRDRRKARWSQEGSQCLSLTPLSTCVSGHAPRSSCCWLVVVWD